MIARCRLISNLEEVDKAKELNLDKPYQYKFKTLFFDSVDVKLAHFDVDNNLLCLIFGEWFVMEQTHDFIEFLNRRFQ